MAKVSAGEAHDAPLAEEMLARGELEGVLLADSACDSEEEFQARKVQKARQKMLL